LTLRLATGAIADLLAVRGGLRAVAGRRLDPKTWLCREKRSIPDGDSSRDCDARLSELERGQAASTAVGELHSSFIDGQRGRPIASADPFGLANLNGCGGWI
jgi:hypothetical protein